MSVVAAKVNKGTIEMAADSIHVYGDWRQEKEEGCKLKRVNGMAIAHAGLTSQGSLFYLYCQTRKPKAATEDALLEFFADFQEWYAKRIGKQRDLESGWLVAFNGKLFRFIAFYVSEVKDFASIGAGEDFAYAAMHMGCSAKRAVQVACELSPFCEPPINTITVKRK